MILAYLICGILSSIAIGWWRPSWRRTFNIVGGVVLGCTFVALMILVFGPLHVDRSEPWIQSLRLLCVIGIGYFADATGMHAAVVRGALRLAGLDTDEESKKVKSARGDDEADGDDPDEPDDDDNRKA